MFADKKQLEAATVNNTSYKSKYFNTKNRAKKIKSLKEIKGW